MTYVPRAMDVWEQHVTFTIAFAPYDAIVGTVAGVVRRREGPVGVIDGERRPPMMVLADMQQEAEVSPAPKMHAPVFNGVLIFAPPEAPGLTVIEHPLDTVSAEGFPASLARVLPELSMVTFDSVMETALRQQHVYQVRKGNNVSRTVLLSRGWDSKDWTWQESGEIQPFEDRTRLARTRIWERLDRSEIVECTRRLGLDPERSLFGRDFAQSVLIWPLPHNEPRAAKHLSPRYANEAKLAAEHGVKPSTGDIQDSEWPGFTRDVAIMERLQKEMNLAIWKADQSALGAKTPDGRERAQRRLLKAIAKIDQTAVDVGFAACSASYFPALDRVMRELGPETESYRLFRKYCRPARPGAQ